MDSNRYLENCKRGLECIKVFGYVKPTRICIDDHHTFGDARDNKFINSDEKSVSFENIPLTEERYLRHMEQFKSEDWTPIYESIDWFYSTGVSSYVKIFWLNPVGCRTIQEFFNKHRKQIERDFKCRRYSRKG